ncbi:hypothetical protein BOTNAR_0002g00800 [Botryotinia narcissicola]|uniref:Uncharacterized protein n=1 Tax=Botryotinia narcissicola TaxID=278944 RepID=A0A4Z1J992_9HELO|nr:hypothetical protein BOTNAR_0002g00800 [Botryotinia narcissicola]
MLCRKTLRAHQPNRRTGSHVAQARKESIQHDERGEIFRRGQLSITAPDDKSQDDVACEAEHPRPLAPDAVHEPHAQQHAWNGEDGEDELPDGDGADVFPGHETVDDSGAHDAIGEIDKVVEEEGGAGAETAEPIGAKHKVPGDGAGAEIRFLEEFPVCHAQTDEHDEQGEERAYAVDGVERDGEIVVRGEQREEIDEGAGGGAGCGHQSRDEDLDGTSLRIERIGGTFEGGGGGGGIFASDADAGDAAGDGEEPEHVCGGMHLEGERGEERSDDHQGGGEEHATLAGKLVRGVAENEDSEDGTDKEGIGNAGLDCGGVDFGAEEVVEYDVCAGCLSVLAMQKKIGPFPLHLRKLTASFQPCALRPQFEEFMIGFSMSQPSITSADIASAAYRSGAFEWKRRAVSDASGMYISGGILYPG